MKLTHALCAVFLVSQLIGADQPKFEEASVKRTDQCRLHNSVDPGRIVLDGVPLKAVLMEAFKVKMDQIIGPSWLDADCFSIAAKIPEGATKNQLPAMLEALLVERFKLTTHKETSLRGGYALIVDKNGPKFKESDPNSYAAHPRGQVTFGFAPAAGGFKGPTTMAWVARYLSNRLGVPVQDLTGMTGTYDLDVSLAADTALEKVGPAAEAAGTSPSPADPDSLPAAANIFSSIRDSLGLRLRPRKAQSETIVIDHIERVPTEN